MKIDQNRLGFDIDGVVADTTEAFIRIARESYGIDNITPADITEFNVTECLPISSAIVEEIFNFLLEEPIKAAMRPMENAVKVLTRMANQTPPITFVTARPLHQPIADWLAHVLPPASYQKARLIAMGDHDGKASFIKKLGLRFFIDDRAETCINLLKHGITPIVFTQPWNKGKHQLQTVENWHGIDMMCIH